jgi:hypothetical protein
MISIEELRSIYKNGQINLMKYGDPEKPLRSQLFRGVGESRWKGQHAGGCSRHLTVFAKYQVIPKYCFDCYKVLVEPENVIELFKLMVIFNNLQLTNDNTRKCIAEGRENITGTYKGFVYCRGIDEGKEMLKQISRVVLHQISKNISVTLKRGCSEYLLKYPEYAQDEKNASRLEYNDSWLEYEDLTDKLYSSNYRPFTNIDSNSCQTYSVQDAGTMLLWLRYAATIGDQSYLLISDRTLPPLPGLKRPINSRPVNGK